MSSALSIAAALVLASEGKWTPQQVLELGPSWVKQQGFPLPLKTLWDERAQRGLLANAVQLPGCSGSFVSAQGLLITNHHCIVSILQEHSTPEQNLVKDGFVARTLTEERQSKSYRILVPRQFLDVTAKVKAALPATATPLERFKAFEAVQKRLVAECEQPAGTRCTFATFDGGVRFTLTEFTELSDVRLVYAPPSAIGDFGGEVDNWMWPRHSGDFALVRVYRDGAPYQPPVFFPLSTTGVREGDAVAVLGYPGASFRASLAADIETRATRYYPALRALTGQWQSLIDEERAKSSATTVATADDLRSVLNLKKNAEGQMAGLRRGQIVERASTAEALVLSNAKSDPAQRDAVSAYERLQALAADRAATHDRDFVLDFATRGARALSWPLLIVRRSVEAQRPDSERELGWQERDLPRLRERHERDQKRYDPAVDRRLFVSLVTRALALPAGQRIVSLDARFGGAREEAALLRRIDELVKGSKVFDLATRKVMFDETPEQLERRHDPLIDLALALDVERRALRDHRDELAGATLEHLPVWRHAVQLQAKRPIAHDANSTLRVSFGRVRGYSPKEAVTMSPFTTVEGALAKHTGEEPFDLPGRIREAMERSTAKNVRIDFLADCDTTGGNSGSPVIDGAGRLVGVNFDRVWENVANDFGYNPEVARNVVADVRYLLWLLREVEHADSLVSELTAAKSPQRQAR